MILPDQILNSTTAQFTNPLAPGIPVINPSQLPNQAIPAETGVQPTQESNYILNYLNLIYIYRKTSSFQA